MTVARLALALAMTLAPTLAPTTALGRGPDPAPDPQRAAAALARATAAEKRGDQQAAKDALYQAERASPGIVALERVVFATCFYGFDLQDPFDQQTPGHTGADATPPEAAALAFAPLDAREPDAVAPLVAHTLLVRGRWSLVLVHREGAARSRMNVVHCADERCAAAPLVGMHDADDNFDVMASARVARFVLGQVEGRDTLQVELVLAVHQLVPDREEWAGTGTGAWSGRVTAYRYLDDAGQLDGWNALTQSQREPGLLQIDDLPRDGRITVARSAAKRRAQVEDVGRFGWVGGVFAPEPFLTPRDPWTRPREL